MTPPKFIAYHRGLQAELRFGSQCFRYARWRAKEVWVDNRERYAAVGLAANVPAEVVAAIHWRESAGNFGTYLHNGEKLGTTTKLVPTGKLFTDWTEAAVDALTMKPIREVAEGVGLTYDTTDRAVWAAFCEGYNGLGYYRRGKPSPYVYSGTSAYIGGKYVADGEYDPEAVDKQPGCAWLWKLYIQVDPLEEVVRLGSEGKAADEVKRILIGLITAEPGVDEVTEGVISMYQSLRNLSPDGVVGPMTWAALRAEK